MNLLHPWSKKITYVYQIELGKIGVDVVVKWIPKDMDPKVFFETRVASLNQLIYYKEGNNGGLKK
jgi:hypothetical protein